MKEVQRIHVVGANVVTNNAHHQHEIHEAVGRIAGLPEAVEGDLAQTALDIGVGDPVDGAPVELGIRPVRAELTRTTQLQRQVPRADDGHTLLAGPGLDQPPQ